jgi:hypothetical protein
VLHSFRSERSRRVPQNAEHKTHRGTLGFEGGFCDNQIQTVRKSLILNGEMSEWLKEHAWKACVGETLPWVRIPLSPPAFARLRRASARPALRAGMSARLMTSEGCPANLLRRSLDEDGSAKRAGGPPDAPATFQTKTLLTNREAADERQRTSGRE